MARLAKALEGEGYVVHNIDYPTRRANIASIAKELAPDIIERTKQAETIYAVGYSLGGLMLRELFAHHLPKQPARMVHLAVPNHGSEVADRLHGIWAFDRMYGPVGRDLRCGEKLGVPPLETVSYELGVLAGDRCLDPFCTRFLPRPHDGKVSVESTKLPGMKDHKVVHATHTFFPTHPEVIEETVHFLKHGRFSD